MGNAHVSVYENVNSGNFRYGPAKKKKPCVRMHKYIN